MHLKWISPDGTEITFSRDATDYKLTKNYSGFANIPVTHQTQAAPFQDGTTLIDSVLGVRQISFEIMIMAENLTTLQTRIRALSSAFNPKKGQGYLVYTNEAGTEYWITCIGNNTPSFSLRDRALEYQRAYIDLVAHDPYWYAGTKPPVYLAGTASAFFPFTFPFSLGSNTDTAAVTNEGDVTAPVTISFVGEMVNPVLTNTATGESVSLNLSMAAGERFVITTHFGNKTAIYYRADGSSENGFPYLDTTSILWDLLIGENVITLTDTSIATGSYVTIEWRDRFVGVA